MVLSASRLTQVLVAAATGGLMAACAASSAEAPQAAAGRAVAQRACGGCHAAGEGPSPLAEAPPFRLLYRRYPPGGLEQLLQEGMLAPERPQEEGSPERHPRMPQVAMDPDEVAALKAFLRSLEPR